MVACIGSHRSLILLAVMLNPRWPLSVSAHRIFLRRPACCCLPCNTVDLMQRVVFWFALLCSLSAGENTCAPGLYKLH